MEMGGGLRRTSPTSACEQPTGGPVALKLESSLASIGHGFGMQPREGEGGGGGIFFLVVCVSGSGPGGGSSLCCRLLVGFWGCGGVVRHFFISCASFGRGSEGLGNPALGGGRRGGGTWKSAVLLDRHHVFISFFHHFPIHIAKMMGKMMKNDDSSAKVQISFCWTVITFSAFFHYFLMVCIFCYRLFIICSSFVCRLFCDSQHAAVRKRVFFHCSGHRPGSWALAWEGRADPTPAIKDLRTVSCLQDRISGLVGCNEMRFNWPSLALLIDEFLWSLNLGGLWNLDRKIQLLEQIPVRICTWLWAQTRNKWWLPGTQLQTLWQTHKQKMIKGWPPTLPKWWIHDE